MSRLTPHPEVFDYFVEIGVLKEDPVPKTNGVQPTKKNLADKDEKQHAVVPRSGAETGAASHQFKKHSPVQVVAPRDESSSNSKKDSEVIPKSAGNCHVQAGVLSSLMRWFHIRKWLRRFRRVGF